MVLVNSNSEFISVNIIVFWSYLLNGFIEE